MHFAYINPLVKEKDVDHVKTTINTYNGAITQDLTNSDLMIIEAFPIYNSDFPQNIQQISINCYKQMVKSSIYPFLFVYKHKYMRNLSLYNKSINITNLQSDKIDHFIDSIKSMGGELVYENADYYLVDNYNEIPNFNDKNMKIVHYSRIHSLKFPGINAFPEKFILNKEEHKKIFISVLKDH